MVFELRVLPARQGDALWVRWGDSANPFQMLVDMGTPATGKALHERLLRLALSQRVFELLVVTHIDSDHIGGVLSCLVEPTAPIDGLEIKDVWFNGYHHVKNEQVTTLEEHGGVQGKKLSDWLRAQKWNLQFGGSRIHREVTHGAIELAGGLKLWLIGPPERRLRELAPTWIKEVERVLSPSPATAKSNLEAMGRANNVRPSLDSPQTLKRLASGVTSNDPSLTNGSSISLLLEFGGRRVLLAGDAYACDLLEGIRSLQLEEPLQIDAFKLPHHGSRHNISKELIQHIKCPLFLVSTDGTQFQHPDSAAIACVIDASHIKPVRLGFNCRSEYTGWWADEQWQKRFQYEAIYGEEADGLTIDLFSNEAVKIESAPQ